MEKHEIIPSIEGYKTVEKTISLKKANIVCIGLFVVFGALCCLVFFLLWGKGGMNFMGEELVLCCTNLSTELHGFFSPTRDSIILSSV